MDLDTICLDAECLLSLEQGQHLNDEIINTTFHLLLTSSNKKDEVVDYVSPHVFETYKKNKEGDQGMLFVDERRTFLHATNFAVILFPLCFDKHWILVIYHKPMKSIVYFDSGRQIFGNDKIMEIISQYLAYLIPETKGAAKLVQKGWTQKDDSSCGVYILYYAFCFLRCVTLHNTDFLTFDPKSRQQLKGALEKRKLTGIARLIFPKTQSGGATTHKSVKHFMAMNCVPLEDYFKSPTAYDSDPENEMISKGFPNNGESPAVPFTPMEKEKITIRIKKDNPNFQSYSNSNNSISSNFSPNTVNGDTSRSMNNFSSRGTTPGGSPTRQPESSTVGKRISMVSNQSTPSPPHKQESFPKATSESLPSGAQRIQMNQQTHSISSNQRTSTTNHHNEHMNQNSSNASYTIHRNAPNNSVPINHINNLSPQHKNKRKDNEEIDLESRPKKLNSVPIRTDASSTKASKEVVIDDLLQFFREKYGEDRPFCPIINSSVTIKLGENTIDSKSAPSEDKGIQCELVPNALFKMIKWKMVDGQVALIFND